MTAGMPVGRALEGIAEPVRFYSGSANQIVKLFRIMRKPWLPRLPPGRRLDSFGTGHFELRQTLIVQHLVFAMDDVVLIEEKRSQRVNFIGGQRTFFTQRHAAADIVP